VSFDRASAKLYRKIANDIIIDLQDAQALFGGSFNILAHYGMQNQGGGPADELRGKIMAKLGCLRMLCSHPGLLRLSADKYDALTGSGSAYASELAADGLLDDLTKTHKLDILKDYVSNFLDQNPGNKVVIFCTFLSMVDMIVETLGEAQCLTYSGRLNAKTKDANKTRFNNDPNIRVLVSSDAGGYGVDLPAANLLINYDLPWSNGMAVQRNGRINRASSEWQTIVVQDILIRGSIEERQHDMLQQKNTVAAAVIDGLGIDAKGGISLDLSSLNQFLQSTSV
jgi:SNF2 family DNA or RNA helicase